MPKLIKLDNVEVTPEEVNDALRQAHAQPQQKEEVYQEDYETAYRQQAAASSFRGHSPVREVNLAEINVPELSASHLTKPIQTHNFVTTSKHHLYLIFVNQTNFLL